MLAYPFKKQQNTPLEMNNCVKCKKAAAFHLQEWYCNSCFCQVIERRIKHYIRNACPIKKNEHLLVLGDLALFAIKMVIEGLPVKLELIDKIPKSTKCRIVVPLTMDNECVEFLDNLFQGKLIVKKEVNIIPIFRNLTQAELKKYTELKKLNCPDFKKDNLLGLLDEMESKYPSTKYSLSKSISELYSELEKAKVKKIVVNEKSNGSPRKNKRSPK